jgi:endoglucanase
VNRREFLKGAAALAVGAALPVPISRSAEKQQPSPSRLPRWRGFNLTEKCIKRREGNSPFHTDDFEMLAEWKFDFVRLPLSYLCWSDADDWMKIKREAELKDLDDAVELGHKHRIHVNLNLHRAPGYCVNPPKEAHDLWSDEGALEACAWQWGMLAKRYKGIPSDRMSFDLLNEPAHVSEEAYVKVVKRLVDAIRAEDSQRLILADGLRWGRDPVLSLAGLGIAQSTRGYDPMQVTHYKANWVQGAEQWPEPTWPLKQGEKVVDKEFLKKDRIAPWKKLEEKGVGIHIGEWGAFNHTPHKVVLAWMRDVLELWKEAGWGWSMWNFRGGFGILDSGREDVKYEEHRGHKLDGEMLALLQQY